MASPFDGADGDDLMSAVAGAPAASLEAQSDLLGAAPVEAVAGSQRAGQSAIVPPASGGGAAAGAADVKAPADAKDDTPKGPTPYQLWEAKRAEVLAERAAKAADAKRAMAAAGKEEIAKFYAARTDRIASQKKQNRLDEQSAKAEAANVREHGAQWDKISRQINTAPKANEKRNVDRFRKLLLSLKNDDGTKKPASAGAGAAAAGAGAGVDFKIGKP